MTQAYLTGVPGWLGTRLARVLVEGLPDDPRFPADPGARPVCLHLPAADLAGLRRERPELELRAGDLRDPASLREFLRDARGATLFHCAGVVHPTRGVKEFYAVNTEGTRHLLQAAEEAGVRRVVVMSSNSPVGVNPAPDHVFTEESPLCPYMHYGRSKRAMERLVGEFQARGRLETVIVRSPWFYGPDQPPRQTLFFTMIRQGRVPVVGDGANRRSMAYVDNICQGMQLAARVPAAAGRVYWIADERPYPMNEVVDTIERLLETEFNMAVAHRRMRLPVWAGQVAQAADWALQGLGIYQQQIHVLGEMNKTIACSVARARAELGYAPRVALEEGMRRSIRWCLAQGLAL